MNEKGVLRQQESVLFAERACEVHKLCQFLGLEYCDLIARACTHEVVWAGRVPLAAFAGIASRALVLQHAMQRVDREGKRDFGLPLHATPDDADEVMYDAFFGHRDEPILTAERAGQVARSRQAIILTLGKSHTDCLTLLALASGAASVAKSLDAIRLALNDAATADREAAAWAREHAANSEVIVRDGVATRVQPMFDLEFALALQTQADKHLAQRFLERRKDLARDLAEAQDQLMNVANMGRGRLTEAADARLRDMANLASVLVAQMAA